MLQLVHAPSRLRVGDSRGSAARAHGVGPPETPITVVQAKVGGGNPGFIIADARGVKYLAKFDPPEFPGIETTTAQVVNRLFWGFGYNVPEDYLVFLRAMHVFCAFTNQ